jgi:peptide/nickel transport system ATP-binding protein
MDLLNVDHRQGAPVALRGKRVAMVLQDPKYSLNPVMPIGKQITRRR